MFKRVWRRIQTERAAVFLEYALLMVAMVAACTPIMPGGPLYEALWRELIVRLELVGLPIF